MTKKQLKTLKKIFYLNQESLRVSLQKALTSQYGIKNVFATKTFLYAEGDIPVCLVAHMDTVHKHLPVDIYYDREQDVMWSPCGLGADDRAGVYAILQIIKDGYRPHVVFTTDEEIGCIGAKTLVRARKKIPFKECHFLIELDRRGMNDCVFYDLDNEEFESFIESYGFQTEIGSYTDICDIAPVWKCAAVNLSIGYLNEHTNMEMLSPSVMFETIRKVENILKDAKEGKTKHYEYIPMPYYNTYYKYGWNPINTPQDTVNDGVCYWCMKRCKSSELIAVTTSDGYIDYYCEECYEKYKELIDKGYLED